VTCIDLDRHSVDEAVTRILEISEDEHAAMCRAIRAEFERIDYDAEAAEIARLLRVPVAA
jgi:Ni,Fe-hydrogenase III large subunit